MKFDFPRISPNLKNVCQRLTDASFAFKLRKMRRLRCPIWVLDSFPVVRFGWTTTYEGACVKEKLVGLYIFFLRLDFKMFCELLSRGHTEIRLCFLFLYFYT